MSPLHDDPNFLDLGARIKTLRQRQGLSLRALAIQSKMSAANISLIERNKISPSASTLIRLADALKVRITALFERDKNGSIDVHYVPVGNRLYARFASAVAEDLGAGGSDTPIAPYLLTLDPGAESGELVMLGGQTFVHCLEGAINFIIEQQHFTLGMGDSLLFATSKLHQWSNPGPDQARMLVVVCNLAHPDDVVNGYLGSPSV